MHSLSKKIVVSQLFITLYFTNLTLRNSKESLSALRTSTHLVKAEVESGHRSSDMDVTAMHCALLFFLSFRNFPQTPLLAGSALQHTPPVSEVGPATCWDIFPRTDSSAGWGHCAAPVAAQLAQAPRASHCWCCNQQLPKQFLQSHQGGCSSACINWRAIQYTGESDFPQRSCVNITPKDSQTCWEVSSGPNNIFNSLIAF